jgi:hypothetical protein
VRDALETPEFRALTVFVLTTLALGTLFYHKVEGGGWMDSFYFCVITLTTIGYSDFYPHTARGKLFTIFFILLGLGILSGFVALLGEHMLKNIISRPGDAKVAADKPKEV